MRLRSSKNGNFPLERGKAVCGSHWKDKNSRFFLLPVMSMDPLLTAKVGQDRIPGSVLLQPGMESKNPKNPGASMPFRKTSHNPGWEPILGWILKWELDPKMGVGS